MKAIERFYEYLDFKGVKPTRYEKDFNLSNGYLGTQLRRKGSLGEDVLNNIIDNCLDINGFWLLTGKGEMLLSSKKKLDDPGERTEDLKYIIELQKDKIDLLEKENRILKKEIESTTDYYIAAEPSTQLKKP